MYSLVPLLSTVLPIIASSLLVFVILLNLFFKIRRKFPISVNCWFCNSWTKVAYDDRNSFDCPTCCQYNGFTKDGDYNKIIPEQHDEFMNKSTRRDKNEKIVSNGLCALCNNNQRLKVYQLANFVPLVEENYDVEIEHFQEQLEKAYKLCKKCDRVLKKTIDKQNAWIFGNRIKSMCTNGFSKVAEQIKKESRLSILAKLDGLLTTVLVFAAVFTTLSSLKFLMAYAPPAYLPTYKTLIATLNTSKVVNFAPYLQKKVKIEPYSVICATGLVYQLVKMIATRCASTGKVNSFLCWVILFLVSWVRHSKNYSSFVLLVEAFSCIYLLATAFSLEGAKPPPQKSGSMRKLVRNLENTCSEVSESDFENISSSSKNSSYSTQDVHFTANNVFNSSFVSAKSHFDADLNKSLNNLHLGFKPPKSNSVSLFCVKRPKPVLSPPKLQTVNSWVAGGFWKDVPKSNLSRSSSESSGFGSQQADFQVLPQRSPYWGEFDRLSINSEPVRLCSSPLFSQSVYRGSPGLIRFENWSDRINAQATQSFRDLSLHSN